MDVSTSSKSDSTGGEREGRGVEVEGWRDGGMEGWRDGGVEWWRDGMVEGWRDGVNVAYHLGLLPVTLSAVLLSLKLPRSWRLFQTGREGGEKERKGGKREGVEKGEGGREEGRKEKELEELLCGAQSYRHEMQLNSLPQGEWSGGGAQRH